MLEHLSRDLVLNALPVAAIVTDADGCIVAWNPQAEALYGWAAIDVIGLPILDVTAPQAWPAGRQIFTTVASGHRNTIEAPLVRRDGSTFLGCATTSPIQDETGEIVGALGLSEDVTDRRVAREVHAADAERLRIALEAGRLGTWEFDVGTGLMRISRRFEEILGLQPGEFGGTRAAFNTYLHPEDIDLLTGARQIALDHDKDSDLKCRVVRPTGELRWIEGRSAVRVANGAVVGSIGVVIDVTDRHLAGQQRDALAACLSLQAQAAELDIESRIGALTGVIVPAIADCCAIHLVDHAAIHLAGLCHRDPALQPFFRELLETFPVSVDQRHGAGAVIATGEPQWLPRVPDHVLVEATTDRPASLAGFRALELRSSYVVPLVSRGRVLGALSLARTTDRAWDDEDRSLVERLADTAAIAIDNAQLYTAEHTARVAAEHNERRLGLLAEVTATLAGNLDLDRVLDALAALLVPRLGDMCTIDVVDDDRRARLAAARAGDRRSLGSLRAAESRMSRRFNEATAVARVIRTGVPMLVEEVDPDHLRQRAVDADQLQQWLTMDLRSAVVVPIIGRGQVLGALSLFGLGPDGRRFAASDVELLVEIGRRAGLAIDNATLYGREHNLAEALQRSLLPEIQPLPGLDLAARYLPSSDHVQVGGDWFDAFPLADGAVGIAVGDAMGHDAKASGAMGQLRSVLRSYAFEGAPPGVVLDKLDRLVQGFNMAQLATIFYGRLEPPDRDGSRLLSYCSAGHPPPVLRRPDGRTELLDGGHSLLIGVAFDQAERPVASVTLPLDALLICYTDGLVEGRHQPIDTGISALCSAVQTLDGPTADSACERILAVLVGDNRDDDIAVLAVQPTR
jgi:PAS domain S-box-containing protein